MKEINKSEDLDKFVLFIPVDLNTQKLEINIHHRP